MVLCAAFLYAAPAAAQNRSEIADGSWFQSTTSEQTGSSVFFRRSFDVATANATDGNHYVLALHQRQGGTTGVGLASNHGVALLQFYVYEPERVVRKYDQLKLGQNSQVGAYLFLSAAGSVAVSTSRSFVLNDACAMKAQAKGIDVIEATNTLKIRLRCLELITALGLTNDEETALFRILGITELTDVGLTARTMTARYAR